MDIGVNACTVYVQLRCVCACAAALFVCSCALVTLYAKPLETEGCQNGGGSAVGCAAAPRHFVRTGAMRRVACLKTNSSATSGTDGLATDCDTHTPDTRPRLNASMFNTVAASSRQHLHPFRKILLHGICRQDARQHHSSGVA